MSLSHRSPVVAIVTALPAELSGVRDALGLPTTQRRDSAFTTSKSPWSIPPEIIPPDTHRITSITLPIALIATGAGKVAAAAGMTGLLGAVTPSHIVCGGIAGSLRPQFGPGTSVIADRCWYYDRDATAVRLPFGVVNRGGHGSFHLRGGAVTARELTLPTATIATGDSVVTQSLRVALPEVWRERLDRSDVVDMESTVWVEIAQTVGIDVTVCRTVFDAVGFAPETRIRFRDACRMSGQAIASVVRVLPQRGSISR